MGKTFGGNRATDIIYGPRGVGYGRPPYKGCVLSRSQPADGLGKLFALGGRRRKRCNQEENNMYLMA